MTILTAVHAPVDSSGLGGHVGSGLIFASATSDTLGVDHRRSARWLSFLGYVSLAYRPPRSFDRSTAQHGRSAPRHDTVRPFAAALVAITERIAGTLQAVCTANLR